VIKDNKTVIKKEINSENIVSVNGIYSMFEPHRERIGYIAKISGYILVKVFI
jgi:hypothetical protein